MATDTMNSISQIGETAGDIWHLLDTKGSLTITKSSKKSTPPATPSCKPSAGWPEKTRSTSTRIRARRSSRCGSAN